MGSPREPPARGARGASTRTAPPAIGATTGDYPSRLALWHRHQPLPIAAKLLQTSLVVAPPRLQEYDEHPVSLDELLVVHQRVVDDRLALVAVVLLDQRVEQLGLEIAPHVGQLILDEP